MIAVGSTTRAAIWVTPSVVDLGFEYLSRRHRLVHFAERRELRIVGQRALHGVSRDDLARMRRALPTKRRRKR
jgi:hypothetical protein